eukprot:Skav217801  [mRNA]  locus=scaffold1782:474961:478996:- [translate_table: standard]
MATPANEVARVMAEAAMLVQETYKDMAGGLGAPSDEDEEGESPKKSPSKFRVGVSGSWWTWASTTLCSRNLYNLHRLLRVLDELQRSNSYQLTDFVAAGSNCGFTLQGGRLHGISRDVKVPVEVGLRPKWSMRGSLSKPLRSNSDGMLDTDPSKAYDASGSQGGARSAAV